MKVNQSKKIIAVIGGGITGLASAFYLQKKIKEEDLPYQCILLDSSPRLGGKIQTSFRDGFVIEKGPDSFLASKQSPIRLAQEVGLDGELVASKPGKSFVLIRDRLHPIPGGDKGISANISPFITSSLFSPLGKLRAAADLILPSNSQAEDQSLGEFFRYRFGTEVLENFIEPLLSGIYTGHIERLSLQSTFPQFHQIEQQYRSLIIGMKKSSVTVEKVIGKDGFLTFKTGLQSFVEAIEKKLEPDSVIKGVKVELMDKTSGQYKICLNNNRVIMADSVIISAGHQAAYQMLDDLISVAPLKELESTSVATVNLAFNKSAIKKDLKGSSFVVARNSDYSITSCTLTHKKWPHAVPEGKVLLRCYVGRVGDEAIINLSDKEISKIVLEDLNKTMSITEEPDFTIVTRWKEAMPQYKIGHKQRIQQVEDNLYNQLPGVFIAGSSYTGIGMPDCIDQAEAAVEKVLNFIQKPSSQLTAAQA